MFHCLLWAIAAAIRPKVLLIADNLCLRQQLLVLQRRNQRPHLKDADRGFWILACRWFLGWRQSLLIVKPETVLRWRRRGWRSANFTGLMLIGRLPWPLTVALVALGTTGLIGAMPLVAAADRTNGTQTLAPPITPTDAQDAAQTRVNPVAASFG